MTPPPLKHTLFRPSLSERYVRFVVELPAGGGDLLQSLRRHIDPLLSGPVLADLEPLSRCSDRVWEAHIVWKQDGQFPDFGFLTEEQHDERMARIEAGLPANLPFRLRPLFMRADEAHPSVDLARFVLLTLPVFQRQFRRRHCCWKRNLFEIGYVLTDGLSGSSVHPDFELENYRLLSSSSSSTHSCPDSDAPEPNWQIANIKADNLSDDSDGSGVRIGHPDTGWTRHPFLGIFDDDPFSDDADLIADSFDLQRDIDFMSGDGTPPALEADGTIDSSAEENLDSGSLSKFHGTRTASVMIAPTPGNPDHVQGLCPGAVIHSYRATDNVILAGEINVAQAVRAATAQGVHVISISLGGYPAGSLYEAIWDAIQHDIIVVAAAGNWTVHPVFPAAYDPCIAVAGTTWDDEPWYGSTFNGPGQDVIDIAAPAPCILGADWGDNFPAGRGAGTSYSAAIVAAVAALWLQHHRDDIVARRRNGVTMQEIFQRELRRTARVPDIDPAWNVEKRGPGIVDVAALLEPIPGLEDFQGRPWNQSSGPPPVDEMVGSAIRSNNPNAVQLILQLLFGEAADVAEMLSRYGEEFVRLLMGNQSATEAMDDLVESIPDGVQDAIDDAGEVVEEVAEAAEDFVDTVAGAVSDGLATAAGWLG